MFRQNNRLFFYLVWNHFVFTKIENANALDLIIRWITTYKLPQNKAYTSTTTSSTSEASTSFKGFGFFKAWTPLGSTISPYLMKTNPWCLCLIWLNLKQFLQKKHLYYPKLLTAASQCISLLKHETIITNWLFTRNNRLFLSAATENTFILEILTFYAVSDTDIQEPINYPLICLHK